MDALLWPLLLLVIGLSILMLEAFVPSGGILGVLSGTAIVGSVGLAYYSGGFIAGTAFLALTTVLVPTAIALLIRWWPNTPFGKLILIQPPPAEEILPDLSPIKRLVGRYGTTKSRMSPSGAIHLDGKTYDAVSDGIWIDVGMPIQVVAVKGRSLIVRPASPAESDELPESETSGSRPVRPMDEVVPDPFQDQ